jgi:hypothetical protein
MEEVRNLQATLAGVNIFDPIAPAKDVEPEDDMLCN